jgi:hypothetical protein
VALPEVRLSNFSSLAVFTGSITLYGYNPGTDNECQVPGSVLAAYLTTLYAPIAHVSAGGSAHAEATTSVAGFLSGADKTKLNGIATGATANSADVFLLDRDNHTGTQTASTISDFNSASRAQTEAELVAGTNLTITPAGTGASRTLTLSVTSSNSADAFLLDRDNHTGTQTASTISDFNSASRAQTEAELVAGSNITITPAGTGASRTLTIVASGATAGRTTASSSITLSNGAAGTGTITLSKSALLFSIESNKAALIIIYSSAAAASADNSRTWATTPPTPGSGVIAQVTLTGAGVIQLDPVASAVNRESTPSNDYTYRVVNNDTTGAVNLIMGYTGLEG